VLRQDADGVSDDETALSGWGNMMGWSAAGVAAATAAAGEVGATGCECVANVLLMCC